MVSGVQIPLSLPREILLEHILFGFLFAVLYGNFHSWYDKDDKYIDVVNEMYNDSVLDDDNIEELDLSKEKDDFER